MYELFILQPMALVNGALVTLYITVASSLLGTTGGVALWLLGRKKVTRVLYTFTDAIRATPNLIIIFLVFYFPFHDLGFPVPNATTAAIVGLAIAQAAYTADTLRSSEALIPISQIDGLKGIGATESEVLVLVTIPNLVRLAWSPHVAFWIGNLKLSSLASVIGAPDLAYVARVTMANTFRSFDAWVAVGIVYIALAVPLAYVAKIAERHRYFRQ